MRRSCRVTSTRMSRGVDITGPVSHCSHPPRLKDPHHEDRAQICTVGEGNVLLAGACKQRRRLRNTGRRQAVHAILPKMDLLGQFRRIETLSFSAAGFALADFVFRDGADGLNNSPLHGMAWHVVSYLYMYAVWTSLLRKIQIDNRSFPFRQCVEIVPRSIHNCVYSCNSRLTANILCVNNKNGICLCRLDLGGPRR